MSYEIQVVLSVLATHYVADFLTQTDWQANNKSKSNWALYCHVRSYGLGLLLFTMVMALFAPTGSTEAWFAWWFINCVLHFATDWSTSRVTSRFYKQEKYRAFFSTIGLDQLIHYVCLLVTLDLLVV